LRLRHQHPTYSYLTSTGRQEVVQFSDFVTPRQLHRREIYHEWFKPLGFEHMMTVPLPTAPGRTRVYQLARDAGAGFSETERSMLTLLRPHLYEVYREAARRRRTPVRLTERQLDVLRCVALGMGNEEIARHLVIAPRTVTKHLENAYGRLGVTSRTAAVARVFHEPEPLP
jgi:DNA-binding CsgD family transcriptional regulator